MLLAGQGGNLGASGKEGHMKHVVVVAHPAEDSFTMGLTRAYVAELERLGHNQQTYDL
jgi:Flavodoxin-like fold